ncbi:MAG: peptidase S41 [Parcubacteria group bacterium]|nr:peptidase S41 [Parcubacteria group bacterium]|tara:strand:- start:2365 stop:3675 length:1311 start_codon:yes stop_codon:yes gene_type:complete
MLFQQNQASQEKPKSKFPKRFLISYSFIVVLALIFTIGFVAGRLSGDGSSSQAQAGEILNSDAMPDYLTEDVDFRQFWEVWEYVKDNYVKSDVSETEFFYGSLAGLVASLGDPYSVFLNPEISNKFEEELSGSFEGIGAEIGIRDDRLTIIAPLPGTPADKAGLLPGDMVFAIDGKDTRGIALDFAVSIIRGEKGTEVVLTVLSDGDEGVREVPIIRGTIEIDSVKFSRKGGVDGVEGEDEEFELMDGDIAYVELLYFNENTLADWNKTVLAILNANPKGIILDLRNNPGGFLGTAIEVAGEWVNGKTVVSERLRSGKLIGHNTKRQARFDSIPSVVLVNGGSASGSEIVAGALQDYGVATIVGETTFGKGSVQDLRKFSDGSSVKLTIAEWLTPNEKNINESGIEPDIVVERTREDYDADLDPQLDKALEILREN